MKLTDLHEADDILDDRQRYWVTDGSILDDSYGLRSGKPRQFGIQGPSGDSGKPFKTFRSAKKLADKMNREDEKLRQRFPDNEPVRHYVAVWKDGKLVEIDKPVK